MIRNSPRLEIARIQNNIKKLYNREDYQIGAFIFVFEIPLVPPAVVSFQMTLDYINDSGFQAEGRLIVKSYRLILAG